MTARTYFIPLSHILLLLCNVSKGNFAAVFLIKVRKRVLYYILFILLVALASTILLNIENKDSQAVVKEIKLMFLNWESLLGY